MNNELIKKFIKENGLGELQVKEFFMGVILEDSEGDTMYVCQPPFTENIIEVTVDNVTRKYQYKKMLDGYHWVMRGGF